VLDWTAPGIPTVADMSMDPRVLSWSVSGSHTLSIIFGKATDKQSRQKYGIYGHAIMFLFHPLWDPLTMWHTQQQ
jgi:hypothetical protein